MAEPPGGPGENGRISASDAPDQQDSAITPELVRRVTNRVYALLLSECKLEAERTHFRTQRRLMSKR